MGRAEPAARSRNLLGTAIQLVLLLVLLAILTGVVLIVMQVLSLSRAPSDVASRATQALTSAQQAVQNITDPNHPPTGLAYDTEFSALDVWHVGDGLPGGSTYVLSLRNIQRRDGASSPDTAEYATIHAELRQPNVTRILGQPVRSDSDPRDYVVYKGEMFRIGAAVYRVNWISQEENAVAVGVVRSPDTVTQALKFQYD
jgi:type II secretory pathway pseudopilin PulG